MYGLRNYVYLLYMSIFFFSQNPNSFLLPHIADEKELSPLEQSKGRRVFPVTHIISVLRVFARGLFRLPTHLWLSQPSAFSIRAEYRKKQNQGIECTTIFNSTKQYNFLKIIFKSGKKMSSPQSLNTSFCKCYHIIYKHKC